MDGAKAGAALTAGSLFLGPIAGPVAGGVAGTAVTGSGFYTVAGVGAGLAYMLASPNPGLLRSGGSGRRTKQGAL